MDLSLGSMKSEDNLKKCHLNELYIYTCPWYSHVILVSRYAFWQLSIDHNVDVHKDVQVKKLYQVKHDCLCLGHLASNAWLLLSS